MGKRNVLSKSHPMGVPWGAIGSAALALGKYAYKHPKVQARWKKFKKDKKLEWLPFGVKSPKNRMHKVNKMKYRKGVVMC